MKMRASIKQFPRMIDAVRQARDKYKSDYETILTVRNDAEKVLPKRFIGEELKKQKAAIERDFNNELVKIKNAFMDSIIRETNNVEDEIRAEVSKPYTPVSILHFLSEGIQISRSEFEILRDSFGGTYWNDRILSVLAERNGITVDVPSDCDTMLSVLRSILSESQALVDEWQGNNENSSPMTRMILHDQRLARWENMALRGVNASLTKQQRATRVLSALNQMNTDLERIVGIANAMRNCADDEDVSQLVMYGISQNAKLYQVGILPFIDNDYQKTIRAYHSGELQPPVITEDGEPDALSPEMQATAEALSELAKQQEEVNARRRAAIAEATARRAESAPQ